MADTRKSKRAEPAMQCGAPPHAVVSSLGRRALAGEGLDVLVDEAVKAVAAGLDNEYAVVFELLPGGQEMFLRAGVGLREGLVGSFRTGAGVDSQAGYTLVADEPVVVEDLATEPRFTKPPLMVEHGVVSGVSVVIHGYDGPWGVLGTHTTRQRSFSGEDVNFVQAVANVLGAAVERRRHEEREERARQQEHLVAVGQRAAGMAHDLNNITRVIGFFVQLLESDQALDEAGHQRLASIREQLDAASSLVWQVLDCAHSGPAQPTEVDLSAFLGELLPVLHRGFPAGASIRLEHDDAATPYTPTARLSSRSS